MKLVYGLMLLVCLLPFHGQAFPQTKSEGVNKRLQACLNTYGCRVTRHAGVCRSQEDRDGAGRSQTSCHLVCKAIDIVAVSCTKSGTTNNHENLVKLQNCLSSWLYTACYAGAGPCNDGHMDHLHFGPREFLGCRG